MQSDNTLTGVQVVAIGEAQGHDFEITEDFLSAVVDLGQQAGTVKVRVNHPEGRGDVLSIVGEASNFRLDGQCVRADVTLFDVPDAPRLLTLARQAGHLFGMSLDFAGETVKKAGQKLKQMTCEAIYAVDFVDTPAATRALFSAGETKNRWRHVCALSLPKVDEKQLTEEHDMAKIKEEKKQLAEIPPVADETEVKHVEPDGDEGQDKVLTALAGIEKRLAALESKNDGTEEKLEDKSEEPPVEDEKKEEQMATMAAKVCSIMLAKVGVKPRAASAPDKEESKDYELSADEAKLAKSLCLDHKQFAANLARAKQVKF
jgi:hypothetical protein